MTDDELKHLFERLGQDIREDLASLRQDNVTFRDDLASLRHDVTATRKDNAALREENAAAHTETHDLFGTTAEGLRHEIRLVAESVMSTRESLDREAADIREEVRRTASDTQAMIKFSHAELDRRMSTLEQSHNRLEDAVADLQARVDRLEGSTH